MKKFVSILFTAFFMFSPVVCTAQKLPVDHEQEDDKLCEAFSDARKRILEQMDRLRNMPDDETAAEDLRWDVRIQSEEIRVAFDSAYTRYMRFSGGSGQFSFLGGEVSGLLDLLRLCIGD